MHVIKWIFPFFLYLEQNQHIQEHQIQQNHQQNNQNNQHLQQIQQTPAKMGRGKHADGKPRGRMTAYAFFVQTCREEHKKKHPEEQVVFAEFSRKCAERWKVSANTNYLSHTTLFFVFCNFFRSTFDFESKTKLRVFFPYATFMHLNGRRMTTLTCDV